MRPETAISGVRPSWGVRLTGIEGLRGIAAFAVVFHHTAQLPELSGFLLTVAGPMRHGLTLFFALSGFLLFRPFVAALFAQQPLPRATRFWRNRWLRIVPGYVAVLVLASFALQSVRLTASTEDSDAATYGMPTDPVSFLLNLFLVQSYVPSTVNTGLPPSWSLSVEIAFYLLLPLLCAAAVALRRAVPRLGWRVLLLPPAVLLVLGFVGKVIGEATLDPNASYDWQTFGASWHAVLDRSLVAHADLFSWGMLAAIVVVGIDSGMLGTRAISRIRMLSAAVIVIAAPGLVLTWSLPRAQDVLVAMASGALILLITIPRADGADTRIARILETLPFRYLGLISFSVYLWHVPVLIWLYLHGIAFTGGPGAFLADFVLISVISIALSSVTYFLVEKPAMRLKRRTARPGTPVDREEGPVEELAAP